MKGSIRFDNEINVEVDVDPTAAEGAKLTSAVNLVDGQVLGSGGDVQFAEVVINSSEEGVSLLFSWLSDEYGYIMAQDAIGELPSTFKIPLGPNGTLIINIGGYDANIVTGEISELDGAFLVTGDGTINVNYT